MNNTLINNTNYALHYNNYYNINNNIISLLLSSFIAHGLLDFITFFPDLLNNASYYLSFMILFTGLMTYIPSIGLIIFIGMSMYHFGEDFRFIFQKKENTRWGGVILFSSSIIFKPTIWIDTLTWLDISNPILLTNLVLLMGIPSVLHIFKNPYSIITPFVIGLGGAIPNLVLYACCIHSPLAMYRYIKSFSLKKEKIECLILWGFNTIIIYIAMPYIPKLNIFVFKVSISIVISHIIYITKWQLKINKVNISKEYYLLNSNSSKIISV